MFDGYPKSFVCLLVGCVKHLAVWMVSNVFLQMSSIFVQCKFVFRFFGIFANIRMTASHMCSRKDDFNAVQKAFYDCTCVI